MIADLANEALKEVSLEELTNLNTNYNEHYVEPERLQADVLIAAVQGLLFKPPIEKYWMVGVYVDKKLCACLDETIDGMHESKRMYTAFLNAIDKVFAPDLDIEGDKVSRVPAI